MPKYKLEAVKRAYKRLLASGVSLEECEAKIWRSQLDRASLWAVLDYVQQAADTSDVSIQYTN